MEKKNNIISRETYDYYLSNAVSLKELVEKLKGKVLEDKYETIEDCGIAFVRNFLMRDWGKNFVYKYSERELTFINSKYLSDYFKDNIKELLDGIMTKELYDILNNDKDINQMDEDEIKMIYNSIVEFYQINKEYSKPNLSGRILSYLYKLDGKGVTSFIKNNIDGDDIARQILLTSGLNDRASYYSGRGVLSCDLNQKHLTEIFMKLLRLDEKYASNFVDMVCNMKTLGATEFINSFINLGINKFEHNGKNIDDKNVSLDDVYDGARDVVAFGTIFSAVNKRDDDYQIMASNTMKLNFLSMIRKNLKNVQIEQIEKSIDKALRDIYGSTGDYEDYELDMMIRRRWLR